MNLKQTLTDLKQSCYVKLKLSNEAKRQLLVYKKLSTKSFESLLTNRLLQNSCLLPGISGKSFSTISFFLEVVIPLGSRRLGGNFPSLIMASIFFFKKIHDWNSSWR